MSPKVSAEIIARADGIPLFVEELSKAVMESGLADVDGDDAAVRGASPGGVVPATLHDSLMARLDRMSLVKPVAQFAAVLGRVFTVQLLSAAAPPHWLPIDGAITALASAEIILPVQLGANPTYQFKHALLQDVAYQSLLKATRRAYHARIAHVIAEQFGTLASLYPRRIDLGLGRAPGTDGLTARALRRSHIETVEEFPRDVQELLEMFSRSNQGTPLKGETNGSRSWRPAPRLGSKTRKHGEPGTCGRPPRGGRGRSCRRRDAARLCVGNHAKS